MSADQFLAQVVIVLGAAVLVVLVSVRLRAPSIVGLILAGMLIGPTGLGLVHETELVEILAEIGVVLLLFLIGLELSVSRLRELARPFLLGGASQAVLTMAGGFVLAMFWASTMPEQLFLAMVVTLSSTAIVLKIYNERHETDTAQGKAALGILLFQDFLIVPMIVLTPVIAGATDVSFGAFALRFAGSLGTIGLVVVAARFAMPRFLDQVVRLNVRELFVLAGLLICLAMSWFTFSLGFSLALGAFLAGILVSDTQYSHELAAEIGPFRDVFASLFFVSIGMLVDLRFAAQHLPLLVATATALIVLKSITGALAVGLSGFPRRTAVIAGLSLAQIGEFSFVLMDVGRANGLLDGDGFQTVLIAAVLTLLATPLLIRIAPALGDRWSAIPTGSRKEPVSSEGEALSNHVIVVGYGMGGALLVRVLREAGIRYCMVELNSHTVRQAQRDGIVALYGDATRRDLQERAGIREAQVVVFVISDARATARGVALARQLNPGAEIIVRARSTREIEALRKLGAKQVVAEEFESAIEIFTRVLARFHVPRNVVRAQTRILRGEGYRMLRTESEMEGVSSVVLDALAEGTTDLYRVGATSRLAGRSLRTLDLRGHGGASVIALVRGEQSMVNPAADQELASGDCLVLVGSHGQVDIAFRYLDEYSEAITESEGSRNAEAE